MMMRNAENGRKRNDESRRENDEHRRKIKSGNSYSLKFINHDILHE
jgi:hypothetical protein